jgi:putative peptidoglycan lipid II flippase
MSSNLNKKSILQKTAQVSSATFISRALALLREVLVARFLGVGAISDAFWTAFKFPNLFRQILAEGALSAAFVPAYVKALKEKKTEQANGLMSASFLFFEGIVLLLYAFVLLKTPFVVKMFAPGFSQEQVAYAIPFLRIMFPYLFFVSSSALFAGALQAMNKFFVPAIGPALWNFVFCSFLLMGLLFGLSPTVACFGTIVGAIVQFLTHVIVYFRLGLKFGYITGESLILFKQVLSKFLPCLFGVGIIEINLFVSSMIASFLPKGTVTLLYYGSRFMNFPLGIFAVALSSILLPHFSRIVLYAPKRLNFYVLEVAKLVTWVIVPAMLLLMFVSGSIFGFAFGNRATPDIIFEAKWILIIYCFGLLFFSINKIFLSIFYSLKDTRSTTLAGCVGALVNLSGDLVGAYLWGSFGIAAAAVMSAVTMTSMYFWMLHSRHGFRFYSGNFFNFLGRYVLQLLLGCIGFIVAHLTILKFLQDTRWYHFFAYGFGFWPLVGILALIFVGLMFLTRKFFRVDLYFLS